MKSLKDKKVLVTGGAGFIGSNLVDELINLDYQVIVIDNLSTGKKEYINHKAKFYKKDIRDYKSIKPLFKNIDCVFHLAAQARMQPSIFDPTTSFHNNVLGTFNILLAAKENKVKKFVYSASSSAYGDPERLPLQENMKPQLKNPYALFKYMGEEMCGLFWRLYKLPTVCLRYFNVYGERQSTKGAYATVIGKFLDQKKRGQPMTIVGDGEQKRDFTYVKDVVRANITAMKSDKAIGQLINIGSGENYTVNQVADLINGKRISVPLRIGEVKEVLADISRAKELLNWQPQTKLEDWIKSQTLSNK